MNTNNKNYVPNTNIPNVPSLPPQVIISSLNYPSSQSNLQKNLAVAPQLKVTQYPAPTQQQYQQQVQYQQQQLLQQQKQMTTGLNYNSQQHQYNGASVPSNTYIPRPLISSSSSSSSTTLLSSSSSSNPLPKTNPPSYQQQRQQQQQLQQQHQQIALQNQQKLKLETIKNINNLTSQDITTIVVSLRELLKSSTSDGFSFETFPSLLINVGTLLDNMNPLGPLIFEESITKAVSLASSLSTSSLSFDANVIWPQSSIISYESINTYKVFSRVLDENVILLSVLQLIRNMSLDVTNEPFLSSSTTVMKHIISLVLVSSSIVGTEISFLVNDILTNIIGRVELTARKRQHANSLWLEACSYSEDQKATIALKNSTQYSVETLIQYRIVSMSLLSYIQDCIMQTGDRDLVIRGIELLTKLASDYNKTENLQVLNTCPDCIIDILVQFLITSTSSIDPLMSFSTSYPFFIASSSTSTTSSSSSSSSLDKSFYSFKPPACIGSSTTFYHEFCDLDLRDIALDAILTLSNVSKVLEAKFVACPNFLTILVRIIESRTKVADRYRKIANLIQSISQKPENTSKILSIQHLLLNIGFKDEIIGEILWQTKNTLINLEKKLTIN